MNLIDKKIKILIIKIARIVSINFFINFINLVFIINIINKFISINFHNNDKITQIIKIINKIKIKIDLIKQIEINSQTSNNRHNCYRRRNVCNLRSIKQTSTSSIRRINVNRWNRLITYNNLNNNEFIK